MLLLQEYLKKYSTISSKFIDDFFSLYDRDTDQSDFVINLLILAKWLMTTKGELKKTLLNSYTKK